MNKSWIVLALFGLMAIFPAMGCNKDDAEAEAAEAAAAETARIEAANAELDGLAVGQAETMN